MLDSPFKIVRSRPIGGSELVQAIRRIRDSCRRHDFVSRTHGEIHTSSLKVHELPSLNAYQRVLSVTLQCEARAPSESNVFMLMTRKTHEVSERHAWTTWRVAESDLALHDVDKYDLNISAGLRKEGYFSGVYIYRPSPAVDDILQRAALFQHATAAIGLSDNINVLMDCDVLRMKAQEPWTLSYPSAKMDGGDPLGFYASGFSDIDAAISAGELLVKRFARKICAVNFVTKLTGNNYNSVSKEVGALWSLWDVDVMGALTHDAIEILKGSEVSSTSPSRVPAFEWSGARGWAACGSVVIENRERFLEIAADGVSAERLQERIAFLSDLQFELI
jgi:hypothetical protein